MPLRRRLRRFSSGNWSTAERFCSHKANSPSALLLSSLRSTKPCHAQKYECPMAIRAIEHGSHRAFWVRKSLDEMAKEANTSHNCRACSALQGIGGWAPTSKVQKVKRLPSLLHSALNLQHPWRSRGEYKLT